MAEKFVVYVFAPPEGEAEAAGNKLAELLKLEPSKVRGLIKRLPDVVTRSVSEREAMAAGRRFQQAGFEAEVRNADTHAVHTRLGQGTSELSGEPASGLAWADESGDGADWQPEHGAAKDAAGYGFADDAVTPEDEYGFESRAGSGTDTQTETEEERAYGRSSRIIEPKPKDEPEAAFPAGTEVEAVDASPFDADADFAPRAGDDAPAASAWQPPAEPEPAAPAARTAEAGADAAARARGAVEAAVAAAAVADDGKPKRRRGSLRSKLLSTAIIPVLLTIVGALAATWFTARPALYDQLLESARNPAIATAATLSSTLERAGGDGIDHLQLLETILITRQAFARQNLSFILATDTDGNPYSGSFLGGSSFPEESLALQNAVRERAIHAVEQGGSGRTGWAEEGATSNVEASGGQRIEIVAQPLMSGNQAIGAVVVGVTDQAVTQQVNRIVINVLLFSLIPLLLAIFIAATRARRLTNNVLTLTQKADEISRGDLDEPVSLRSNDELDDLSAALERMRVSMSGALERLRRRR
ncbi:MAG: HAMP domain-containing protein [Trueperaceae bacterium]